jgi:Holliday junction resolvase
MGASGPDVQLSGAAKAKFPFAIECKNKKRMALYRDYEQAQAHAESFGGIPALFVKENGKDPLVVVDAEWFIQRVVHL